MCYDRSRDRPIFLSPFNRPTDRTAYCAIRVNQSINYLFVSDQWSIGLGLGDMILCITGNSAVADKPRDVFVLHAAADRVKHVHAAYVDSLH